MLCASRCLHGHDVRDTLFEDVARLFRELGKSMTALTLFLPHAPIPAHARRDKVRGAGACALPLLIQRCWRHSVSCLPAHLSTLLSMVWIDLLLDSLMICVFWQARKEMVALFSDIISKRRAEKASGAATEETTDLLQAGALTYTHDMT